MKELVGIIKKDLELLHKGLKKEGDELVKQIVTYAKSEKVQKKRREIEAFVAAKLKEFEPKVEKFVVDVKKAAKKHGYDGPGIEKKISKAAKYAKKKIKEIHDNYKDETKKKVGKVKRAAASKVKTKKRR